MSALPTGEVATALFSLFPLFLIFLFPAINDDRQRRRRATDTFAVGM